MFGLHEQKAAKKENLRKDTPKPTRRWRNHQGSQSVNGDFNPELVPKHQRHFNGFDDAFILYSRGCLAEIQESTKRAFPGNVESSPTFQNSNNYFR